MAKKETGKKNSELCKNLLLAASAVKNKSPGILSLAIFIFKIRLLIGQAFISFHQDSGLQYSVPRNPGKKFEFSRLMPDRFHPVQQPTPASRIPDILFGVRPYASLH
jgi:hypothetical protein